MTDRAGEARGFRHVGHSDLGGYGDGMQVLRHGDAVYVGHLGSSGMGTTVLDASDPTRPAVVLQLPAPEGTHRHKVQVADGLLLVNEEQFRGAATFSEGLLVYSLDDPFEPRLVGRMATGGKGVHRIVWTGGRYASMSATPAGHDDRIWIVVDLDDPARPVEVGRWAWPGAAPAGKRYAAHHALFDGDVGFLGYCDAGMVVLDVSDPTAPRRIGHVSWSPGGDTHTCLPLTGRGLVVVTDEALKDRCAEEEKRVRIVDVTDPTEPRVIGLCPRPEGDFCERGLRFGPHNLHENRPGSYRSGEVVFVTYFNAGLRVYDLADSAHPVEIAHWIPDLPPGQEDVQTNDLYVEENGRVWVTDRIAGGLDVLEPEPGVAQRLEEARL